MLKQFLQHDEVEHLIGDFLHLFLVDLEVEIPFLLIIVHLGVEFVALCEQTGHLILDAGFELG